MRSKRVTSGGVSVRAISGTHVVFLAFDLSSDAEKAALVSQSEGTTGLKARSTGLRTLKIFEAVNATSGPGLKVSTLRHPM